MSMSFRVRDKVFSSGTHIMGILNVTPDSFYHESRIMDDIVARALEMCSDGAEIIDIGGQSTRPGYKQISAQEELARAIPAVEAVRKAVDIPISVDTYVPKVADAALEAGADMINDTSGFKDPALAEVIARHGAAVCIMHNRRMSSVKDLMKDKLTGLASMVDLALRVGIEKERIILDGGIGFNKSSEEDWQLMDNYSRLATLGYPLLLGASRKSFLGGEVNERLSATLSTTSEAASQGILFVRVHDVKENKLRIDSFA